MVNRKRGGTIAETAASLVLLLPLLIMILFVGLEASRAYMIKESLAQASRQAARDLAVIYGRDGTIANNSTMEAIQVYDNIRINGAITSSRQFSSQWNTSAAPPTVTVTVQYTSGQNGLPTFPNPDPLKLGGNFQLNASSTYRLE
jgi:Flp pilus assembly protein TadG